MRLLVEETAYLLTPGGFVTPREFAVATLPVAVAFPSGELKQEPLRFVPARCVGTVERLSDRRVTAAFALPTVCLLQTEFWSVPFEYPNRHVVGWKLAFDRFIDKPTSACGFRYALAVVGNRSCVDKNISVNIYKEHKFNRIPDRLSISFFKNIALLFLFRFSNSKIRIYTKPNYLDVRKVIVCLYNSLSYASNGRVVLNSKKHVKNSLFYVLEIENEDDLFLLINNTLQRTYA